MMSIKNLRELALSLPATTEVPHFEKTSFRVKGKIFASYDEKANRASIKLSLIDQDVFCKVDRRIIFPVDNKWGKQGWTIVELSRVNRALFMDALKAAYREVAPSKLREEMENRPKVAKSGEVFLSTLAAPARRALQNEGITTLKKLSSYSESELLQLHGIGKTSIPKLKAALAEIGLRFKT